MLAGATGERPLLVVEFVRRAGSVVDFCTTFHAVRGGLRDLVDCHGQAEAAEPLAAEPLAAEPLAADALAELGQHLTALMRMMTCPFDEVQVEGYQAAASLSSVLEYATTIARVIPLCLEHLSAGSVDVQRLAATILANLAPHVAPSPLLPAARAALQGMATRSTYEHRAGQREATRALAALA